jgi:hypothetical protein
VKPRRGARIIAAVLAVEQQIDGLKVLVDDMVRATARAGVSDEDSERLRIGGIRLLRR